MIIMDGQMTWEGPQVPKAVGVLLTRVLVVPLE